MWEWLKLYKLLGYIFIVEYKKGRKNKVADALSCKRELEDKVWSLSALITFPTLDWKEELKSSYAVDPEMHELMLKLDSKL